MNLHEEFARLFHRYRMLATKADSDVQGQREMIRMLKGLLMLWEKWLDEQETSKGS